MVPGFWFLNWPRRSGSWSTKSWRSARISVTALLEHRSSMFVGIGRGTEIRVCLVTTKGVGPEATVLKGMFSPFTPIAWFNFDPFQNLLIKRAGVGPVTSNTSSHSPPRLGCVGGGSKKHRSWQYLGSSAPGKVSVFREGNSWEDSSNGDVLLQLHFWNHFVMFGPLVFACKPASSGEVNSSCTLTAFCDKKDDMVRKLQTQS